MIVSTAFFLLCAAALGLVSWRIRVSDPEATVTELFDRLLDDRAVRLAARVIAGVGVVLLGVFGLTACDDDDPSRESAPATAVSDRQHSADSDTDSATDAADGATDAEDADTEDAADTDAEDRRPAGLPDQLPDVGLPFYYPSELVASPSAGDPWVLEFVTDHELTIVNNTIAHEFSESNGWQDVVREVNGQLTVTTGSKDGYLLVIAVASEPSDDFKTSLYYTLSTQ